MFGAFLILTGIKMLRQRDEHADLSKSRILRWFRSRVPHTDGFRGQRFWVREGGVLLATPLLSVLVMIELTDVIFAVDSIPAIFAVTQEPFLVFTANAFAILGLRALYFLLADLMDRFVYLKTGLAIVLLWVGAKMMLHIWDVKVPTLVSLGVVVAIIGASVLLSLRATRPERQAAAVGRAASGGEAADGGQAEAATALDGSPSDRPVPVDASGAQPGPRDQGTAADR